MTQWEQAKNILDAEACTCVLCGGQTVYKSQRRGVAPLLQFLDEGVQAQGFSAADRVVGKATAYLYCLLGVKEVYAHVMSVPAEQVLKDAGITADYGQLVEGIRNRQQNGPCPMEYATRNSANAQEALAAIRTTLRALTNGGS